MSGETEQNISGWTVDTLHSHLLAMLREKDIRDNQRFEAQQLALRDALTAQEKAVNAALLAAQTAVQKAESAAERRFESVNEFRAQLNDQATTLMPRGEALVLINAQAEKITILEGRVNSMGGRSAGLSEGWGYLVGAVGVILAIAGIVLATR